MCLHVVNLRPNHDGPQTSSLCTLIFSVTTLHLLVYPLLHFALKDAGPGRLVVVGDLEDVGGIYPVIGASAHDMIAFNSELIDRHLLGGQLRPPVSTTVAPTLLYVAL